MANKFKITNYLSDKEILKFADHFVAIPVKITASDSAVVTEGNRKLIKAGTIYPKNDATAKGVILSTADVTDGDQLVAMVIHGFIDKTKLPAEPAETVNLPLIQFL